MPVFSEPIYSLVIPSEESVIGYSVNEQVNVVEMLFRNWLDPFFHFRFGLGEVPHLDDVFSLNTLIKIYVDFFWPTFYFFLSHTTDILILEVLEVK